MTKEIGFFTLKSKKKKVLDRDQNVFLVLRQAHSNKLSCDPASLSCLLSLFSLVYLHMAISLM